MLLVIFILFGQLISGQHHHPTDPERDKDRWMWQMPNRVIKEIGVSKDMVVADVGAGRGYFTFPLAEHVGSNGKVYASDVDRNALAELGKKYKTTTLKNIEIIVGEDSDPLLPENKIDLILMVNVLHYIDDFQSFTTNMSKSLKAGSTIVIVEWDLEKMNKAELVTQTDDEFLMSTTLNKIYDANLEVKRILNFLPLQNIYVCNLREK